MKRKSLLERVERKLKGDVVVRRYDLPTMISESYKACYDSPEGSNLRKLAESHLADVKSNPTDTERLSKQLCVLNKVIRMTESGDLKDEDLVDKKSYDTVEPKKERAKVLAPDTLDESSVGDLAPEEARSEISNAWSYGPGGTPRDSRHSDASRAIFDKYNYESEYDVDELTDEEAIAMWKELSALIESEVSPRSSVTKSLAEADDVELTDEEVEELAKHLDSIRKERKTAPKTDVKETKEPRKLKRRVPEGAKPRKLKRRVKEADTVEFYEPTQNEANQIVARIKKLYGDTVSEQDYFKVISDVTYKDDVNTDIIDYALEKAGIKIRGFESKKVTESKSYTGLKNFKKNSNNKAFLKTFKKLDKQLHEGTALTRQDSISLYKAANSAMTQLAIELEHNPEFLNTFNECTSVLSTDVASILESLKRGKAPSKKTMKSLAKFSESLLYEDEDIEDEELDIDVDDLPSEDDDFVGDDEGDIASEEVDEFDQEYADARADLHKELVDAHIDSEDPEVLEKLEKDAEEVLNLPGLSDEKAEEIAGTPEDTEEPEVEDDTGDDDTIEGEDGDEITDDELEELKKHLTEMRKSKRLKESESQEASIGNTIRVVKDLDYYTSHGYKENKKGYVVKKSENYGVFIDGYNYLIPHSDYEIVG